MKMHTILKQHAKSLVLLAITVAAIYSPVLAEPPAKSAEPAYASSLDGKTSGANIRASKLIGMSIQNPQGQNVGTVNDLVIDASSGTVQYAAVTYGGFLGIGDKMFAVPFEALRFNAAPNNTTNDHNYVLVLDVTPEHLKGSVGFDEKSWPDFADRDFSNDLFRRYRVRNRMNDRGAIQNRNPEVDVNINRGGVDVNVDRK